MRDILKPNFLDLIRWGDCSETLFALFCVSCKDNEIHLVGQEKSAFLILTKKFLS